METESLPSSLSWSERVRSIPPSDLEQLSRLVSPRLTPYIPHTPTVPQAAFLLLNCREALYGGAAGGGKSDALLMAALQYVDVPGYSAILFRKKFTDLGKSGALMDRAGAWLTGTGAKWNDQKHMWTFPSGAVLAFGYLESETDFRAYQGAEFQYVGFDELTQHEEKHYKYLFSRLRRLRGANIPIRMRAASNPGDSGHAWVFDRFFIDGPPRGRVFIPARLEDNPYLDQEEYDKSLDELDPILRAQLRNGDWTAIDRGNTLVPEFTPEVKAKTVGVFPYPERFRPYSVADTGTRDLTVTLYSLHDFMADGLYIAGEDVLRDPNTGQFGSVVGAREADLWGTWAPNSTYSSKGAMQPKRYADASLRLSVDLKEDHNPDFANSNAFSLVHKRKREVAINRARQFIGDGRVRIHPSCKVLIATLEGAVYNEKRTDFMRNSKTGHADAWMALVYTIRMVDWRENPYPELRSTWDGQVEEVKRSKFKGKWPQGQKVEPLS